MSFFLRLNIGLNYRKPVIQQEMINVFQNCTFFIKLVKKKKKKKKSGQQISCRQSKEKILHWDN